MLKNIRPIGQIQCAVLVLTFLITSKSASAINIESGFDHASLDTWSGNETAINLVGRDNFYGGGQWRWLHFKVEDALGHSPEFSISSNFAGGASRLDNHRMVYSYDGDNWFFFDNNARNGGTYSFGNNSHFVRDQIFVAYAQPYSYGRSVSHTEQVLDSQWAEPTASANTLGVIGMSPGGVDDLGRTIEPRPLYGYRISNFATDNPRVHKKKVVLSTGMHAGEVLGTHTFEGLVDWLISDDPRAAALRNIAEFFAYPTLNPDGRFAGNSRATVENPNQDPNGLWNPSLWQSHQDIKVSGEAMIADVKATPGNTVEVYVDLHSTIPTTPNDDFGFIEVDQGDNLSPFWLALRELQPNIQEVDSTSTGWTSANFAEAFLNAEVDITFETQFGLNRPLSYYRTLGENFGLAFFKAFVPQVEGDFNADGKVGSEDYHIWLQTLGQTGPNLLADGNGDQLVDIYDYLYWKERIGISAPADGIQSPSRSHIPEPATATILMTIVVTGALLCAKRSR